MLVRGRLPRLAFLLYGVFALLFLGLPIVIIVIVSFDADPYAAFPPPGFSLQWYQQVLGSPAWQNGFGVSLVVATITAVLATILGLLAALALVRSRIPFKQVAYALLLAPMVVPGIITGLALYSMYSKLVGVGSIPIIALGHTALALPVASIILSATLQGVDTRIEKAAASLGAGRLLVLWRITLPLVLPGLVSATLFAFLSSFDEFFVALFFSTPSVTTLPIRIWASLTYQIDPSIAAVSTILIAFTLVMLGLIGAIQMLSSRRRVSQA